MRLISILLSLVFLSGCAGSYVLATPQPVGYVEVEQPAPIVVIGSGYHHEYHRY